MLSEDTRAGLIGQFLAHSQEDGLTLDETVGRLKYAAEVLEYAEQQGIDPCELAAQAFQAGHDKQAFVGQAATAGSLGALAGAVLGRGADMIGHATGSVIDAAGRNVVPAAIASMAIPAGVGYLAGTGWGKMNDDADDAIAEIKHRELLAMLQKNTRQMQPPEPSVRDEDQEAA